MDCGGSDCDSKSASCSCFIFFARNDRYEAQIGIRCRACKLVCAGSRAMPTLPVIVREGGRSSNRQALGKAPKRERLLDSPPARGMTTVRLSLRCPRDSAEP